MSEPFSIEPDWGQLFRDLIVDLPPSQPIPVDLMAELLIEMDLTEAEAVRRYKRLLAARSTAPS